MTTSGVEVRFLVARGLPLLVAGLADAGPGGQLVTALLERGLVQLPGFLGIRLPHGARVGFVVDRDELRLVDERDTVLMRAPRTGVDAAWLEAALRLKGTMTVVVRDLDLDPDEPAGDLAERVDAGAREGRAVGAIVGVAEQRETLPLWF